VLIANPRTLSYMEEDAHNSQVRTSHRRIVTCPQCKGESVYHASNPARPFCSPRCKAMDLGAWANEDFRVAASQEVDASDTEGV
jgi:endogenous inhibitor of DNA gyrase (YacG/DUF329 family)